MSELFDVNKAIKSAIEEAFNRVGHANVLVAGRTGVGKSTLINSVFQGNIATTGQGRPVTLQTRKISKEGVPVSIIDTRGLELNDFDSTLREVLGYIQQCAKNKDPKEHVHVAWICISEDSRRVETAESDLCTELAKHVPVLGIITKARSDNGFRQEVQSLLPSAANVVRVRALAETYDDGHSIGPMGLQELIGITLDLVPEGQRNAVTAAQRVNIEAKKNRAHLAVVTAASTAAAAAATPIPFSDFIAIAPIQISMLAGISAVFGLEVNQAFLSTLVTGALGSLGATITGRALVGALLKFVPGFGSVTGGAIAATTAAALTTGLGEAYIGVLVTLMDTGEEITAEEVVTEMRRIYGKGKRAIE